MRASVCVCVGVCEYMCFLYLCKSCRTDKQNKWMSICVVAIPQKERVPQCPGYTVCLCTRTPDISADIIGAGFEYSDTVSFTWPQRMHVSQSACRMHIPLVKAGSAGRLRSALYCDAQAGFST